MSIFRRVRVLAVLATLIPLAALQADTSKGKNPDRMPAPHDWSHRHLVFSAPSSIEHARKLQQQTRYWHQWLKHKAPATQPAVSLDSMESILGAAHEQADNDRHDGHDGHDGHDAQASSAAKSIHRDWGMSLGANATAGAEMFPAKYTFDVNAVPSCANDYIVFNTSLVGNSTHPSVVAFNNLYSTQGSTGGYCNHNGASVMWSYDTNAVGNTTGKVVTSVALSQDGKKIAYVETNPNANGGAVLHVLRGIAGQGTVAAPVVPDQLIADWSSCLTGKSCVVNITFNGGQKATNSAPFVDYDHDALYVGDDNGVLHKFTGVFYGAPAEVNDGSWPIAVNATAGAILSSPVFDAGSGNIYVGDATGQLSYVQDTNSTVGSCATAPAPPCLGATSQALGGAIVDAPLVDSALGTVYAFEGTDSTNNGSVYEFDATLAAWSVTTPVGGTSSNASHIHAGAFDNGYLNDPNGNGVLYVCGKDPNYGDRPAIHQITISNGQMNNYSDGRLLLVSGSNEECSPVTEIYNTASSTEWLFFSVGRNANQTSNGCSTNSSTRGCLMALNLTNLGGSANWPPANVDNGYPLPTGSTYGASSSGIVVDNVASSSAYPQASSIYFTFIRNSISPARCNGTSGVGCGVKLTQSGLQ
jgi:hypothetical protein